MTRFDVLNCQSGSLAVGWPTFVTLAVNLFMYVFDANPQTQDRALFDSVQQKREKQTCKRKDQKLPKEFRVKLGLGLPK